MTADEEGVTGAHLSARRLLSLLRKVPDDKKLQYRDLIERELFKLNRKEGKAHPGAAQNRLQLLAYLEIIAFDRDGFAQGLAKNPSEAVVQLSELFQHTLRFDVASNLLSSYRAKWPKLMALKSLSAYLKEREAPRVGFKDDPRLDIQVVRRPGAKTTFVIFCGLAAKFGQYLNIIHHGCMVQLDVNVIYLRDFTRHLYLIGLRSVGTLDESCDRLRTIIAELGTTRLVCMGNSGGVFAALYYGSLLPADRIVVFSGPASLELGFQEAERQAYQRLHDLRAEGKFGWPDLRAIYSENKIPVDFYFGQKNRVDAAQANTLAGLSNVKLHPLDSANHVVIDELKRAQRFDRILADAAGAKALSLKLWARGIGRTIYSLLLRNHQS